MFSRLSLFTLAILQASTVLTHAAAPDVVTYEKDVRPILKAHCFHCHGESAELSGELDLRLTRLMIRGGESGPAITAGKPAESLMVEYLTDGLMPPEEVENRPTDRQIETIIQWIAQGAPTEQAEPESLGNGFYISEQERSFWSFRPIVRPSLPKISQTAVAENGIDFFIAAKLEDHDLIFSPAAEDFVLIRRVYLDLLGLPPTPAALQTYAREKQPDVYDKLVDQLLASPAYGQRWGRHWLDAAGYADSEGYTDADAERPWAFKYRDYVIDSFNRDKPYDQFIVEQLAGDELLEKEFVNLSQREREPLIATGFLRNAPDGTGSGAATDVARNAVVSETIKLVTSSLVGLTVGCAQCHHHRYDPISQEDYYRLRAIFEPAYNWKAWRTPAQRQITLYTDADRARKAEVEAKVKVIAAERATKQQEYITATFEKEIAKLPAEIREDVRGAHDVNEKDRTEDQKALIKKYPSTVVTPGNLYLFDSKAAEDLKTYDERQATLRKTIPAEEFVRCLTEPAEQAPPPTFVFSRGNLSSPLQEVQPSEITVLALADKTEFSSRGDHLPTTGRRLSYARWLTSDDHPLLARVIVNRLWMHHFGMGIVDTPGDFGYLGGRPSHPQLLDWLAAELIANDWSLKHIQRLILTSATYRQSSTRHDHGNAIDRQKRLLWSMPVRRMETEIIRDSILATSGMLNQQAQGPAVPVMADRSGQWVIGKENLNAGRPGAVIDMQGQQHRRSIYIQVRRSRPLAVLEPFDLPTLSPNCNRRSNSTVAPQSLQLLNSQFVTEQSRLFADRLMQSASTMEERIQLGWTLAYGSVIQRDELVAATQFVGEAEATLQQDYKTKGLKEDPLRDALALFCHALISSNRFIYIE